MNIKLIVLLALIGLSNISYSFAQKQDSIRATSPVAPSQNTNKSSIASSKPTKDAARLALERMPRRATVRSLIIPGLGQITNKRWWKVPLIYGGLLLFIDSYNSNNDSYHAFLKEAQYRAEHNGTPDPTNTTYNRYPDNGIITNKDLYRRNRDLCILGIVSVYAANVIDAYIDAKFFRFDISDKLSLRVSPTLQTSPQIAAYGEMPNPAIKISLSL